MNHRARLVAAILLVVTLRAAAAHADDTTVLGVVVPRALAEAEARRSARELMLPNGFTRALAARLTEGASDPVGTLISAVQAVPYRPGASTPKTLTAIALGHDDAALDCDERAYALAALVNALPAERRTLQIGPTVVAIGGGAVVAAPRMFHALGLLEVATRPAGYNGPLPLIDGRMFLTVELTARRAVGAFDAEWLAVLADRAGCWEMHYVRHAELAPPLAMFGSLRGGLRWPSAGLERYRETESGATRSRACVP